MFYMSLMLFNVPGVCFCFSCLCACSGELSPEEVIKLMKQCNPPVGWGTLCPRVVAYRVSPSLIPRPSLPPPPP